MGWHGPMTDLQFLAWQEWLILDLNVVDKDTAYLMQIAAEVRRPNSKHAVRVSDMQLKFKEPRRKAETREDAAKRSGEAFRTRLMQIATARDPKHRRTDRPLPPQPPGSPATMTKEEAKAFYDERRARAMARIRRGTEAPAQRVTMFTTRRKDGDEADGGSDDKHERDDG